MNKKWLQVGHDEIDPPYFIDTSLHNVFYLRVYATKNDLPPWKSGEDARLMFNFKKPVSSPKNQLRYKKKAAKKFENDLRTLLTKINSKYSICITWMPGSKHPKSEAYDDSLQNVVKSASRDLHHISPKLLFYQEKDRLPMHQYKSEGKKRNPLELQLGWEIARNIDLNPYDYLFVIDDMLTAGTSVNASTSFLRKKLNTTIPIYHLCWARKIWDDEDS